MVLVAAQLIFVLCVLKFPINYCLWFMAALGCTCVLEAKAKRVFMIAVQQANYGEKTTTAHQQLLGGAQESHPRRAQERRKCQKPLILNASPPHAPPFLLNQALNWKIPHRNVENDSVWMMIWINFIISTHLNTKKLTLKELVPCCHFFMTP